MLEPFRQEMETKGWQNERLKGMILQSVALYALGEKDKAILLLDEVLLLAEPGGFIRSFVDEGEPMRKLIAEYCSRFDKQDFSINHPLTDYTFRLLAAFEQPAGMPYAQGADSQFAILEPLSQREMEILKLISQGLSNREIGERLFLALDTVKGHNRRIFDKLQVQRRTEAVARARRLGLL
jgi:LuxR family maltose regulon positive regulatory protein